MDIKKIIEILKKEAEERPFILSQIPPVDDKNPDAVFVGANYGGEMFWQGVKYTLKRIEIMSEQDDNA